MVGDLWTPCFFKHSTVLLVMVFLHDVEADGCRVLVEKTVGETVNLLSCSTGENITFARWIYGNIKIAEWDQSYLNYPERHQFKGRVHMDLTNFSLTLRSLTLQDSGNFSLTLDNNSEQQLPTTTVTLHVHESITEPDLLINSTWNAVNRSCTVLLECSVSHHGSISYKWTVGNMTYKRAKVHILRQPQDGETTVTCTVSNSVSEKSMSALVTCSNITSSSSSDPEPMKTVTYVVIAAGIVVTILVVMSLVAGYRRCRHTGTDMTDNTIYADISDNVPKKDVRSNSATIYETIDDRVNIAIGPQTIYDKIQLNRPTEASASLYQDVFQAL
ncbi:signaling lymphocytic activation molecule isoform 1-T1 [Polymixia lowei]